MVIAFIRITPSVIYVICVGLDSEAIFDLYIKTYNECLRDLPQDFNAGIHLCRGNFKVKTLFIASIISNPEIRMGDISLKVAMTGLPSNCSTN